MIKCGIEHEWCWVQVELTDKCNFQCVMCPQGMGKEVHRAFQCPPSEIKFQYSPVNSDEREIKRVFLVGDFNFWGVNQKGYIWYKNNPSALMNQVGNHYEKIIKLFPGRYRYQFVEEKKDGSQETNPHFSSIRSTDEKLFDKNGFFIKSVNSTILPVSGYMSRELFQKILYDIVGFGQKLNEIALFWNGESLLHPELKELMSILAGINQVYDIFNLYSIHTNASLLTEENSLLLLELSKSFKGFSKITFSIDADCKEVFSKVRKGGNFNNVVSNIQRFLELRERYQIRKIRPVVQFIVNEENANDVKGFLDFWENYFSSRGIPYRIATSFEYSNIEDEKAIIFLRAIDSDSDKRDENSKLHKQTIQKLNLPFSGDIPGSKFVKAENISAKQIPKTLLNFAPKKIRFQEKEQKIRLRSAKTIKSFNKEKKEDDSVPEEFRRTKPCYSIFQSMFIQWNGEASVCCSDNLLNLKIGDFNKQSFEEIWHGETVTLMRLAHMYGQQHKFSQRCLYCPQWNLPKMPEIQTQWYSDFIKSL